MGDDDADDDADDRASPPRLAGVISAAVVKALQSCGEVSDFPQPTVAMIAADLADWEEHLERPLDQSDSESFWVDECRARITFADLAKAMFSEPNRVRTTKERR